MLYKWKKDYMSKKPKIFESKFSTDELLYIIGQELCRRHGVGQIRSIILKIDSRDGILLGACATASEELTCEDLKKARD